MDNNNFDDEDADDDYSGESSDEVDDSDDFEEDWVLKFRSLEFNLDEEKKSVLKQSLITMRDGKEEVEKVETLMKRPVRRGLRHNATTVG